MSRTRLTACLTGATAAIAAATSDASSHYWPADLIKATTPLRQIAAGTTWLATRLSEAAHQITDPTGQTTYPVHAQEAARYLPDPMGVVTEHCRQINAGWESVAAHHTDTLAGYTPRHTWGGLTAPLDTAGSVLTHARSVAGSATSQQLWPIDWIRTTEQLRDSATYLSALTGRLHEALASGALTEPALSARTATRTALRQLRSHYRAVAGAWLDTFVHLDAIEATRKTLPQPDGGFPAIGM